MSEVTSRSSATRGRGSGRGGRGGLATRGGSRSQGRSNGTSSAAEAAPSLEEQGELGKLKKNYKTELVTLKELFSDWTDDDLVFALQETNGDLETTIERISEGHVSRFADVVKPRDKSRAPKDSTGTSNEKATGSVRGRGRGGSESARGGSRGRGGSERGRTASRGGRGGANAARAAAVAASTAASVPTAESTGWGEPNAVATGGEGAWDTDKTSKIAASTADAWNTSTTADTGAESEAKASNVISGGTKKSWASMLAPKVAPAVPKVAVSTAPVKQPQPEPSKVETSAALAAEAENIPPPTTGVETPDPTSLSAQDASFQRMPSGTNSIDLSPPKDRLTEDNLDNLPDASVPPATDTVASTRDASSIVGSNTPSFSAQHQQPIGRPPPGGFATTAWRATGTPGRTASYQRRLLEQQEAVVMPGNHAVDRTAVQFGSMGLSDETRPADFDDDREDAETRAQPPQQSPAQPRASLPPVPQVAIPPEAAIHEAPSAPAPKQAPGLPPPGQQQQQQQQQQQPVPGQQAYGQYGRYAPGLGQEQGAQKPYDAFSGQLNYPHSQAEQSLYGAHSQAATAAAPTSLAGSEHASQYGSQDQRNAYHNYYGGSYGQLEQSQPPQRSASGLGNADSAYGTQTSQSRFSETPGSGHNTPAPSSSAQQPTNPQSHQQPLHGQGQHGAGYGYGNPYYQGSYYGNYVNQYPGGYGGYNQQGYGGPYGGKGGMYGQSHQGYGMPPQGSYDHSSSPANAGAFGHNAMQSRDSGFGSGSLNDQYSRTGSTQPMQTPSQPAGFGGGSAADAYGRSSGGYGSHSQFGQASSATSEEPMKAYDSKTGPSPALGQPGRTGSAMNSSAQGSQSGYAPPGNQGFGGYPNHLHNSYGSQHGGLGGLGGQHSNSGQSHQSGGFGGGYGGYNSQYGSYGRGGWGGSYGH